MILCRPKSDIIFPPSAALPRCPLINPLFSAMLYAPLLRPFAAT